MPVSHWRPPDLRSLCPAGFEAAPCRLPALSLRLLGAAAETAQPLGGGLSLLEAGVLGAPLLLPLEGLLLLSRLRLRCLSTGTHACTVCNV